MTDRNAHEFARDARRNAPVEIELDEEDLYALTQGDSLAEVLETGGPEWYENDTWVDWLCIQWRATGSVADRPIEEVAPDIFEGRVEDA